LHTSTALQSTNEHDLDLAPSSYPTLTARERHQPVRPGQADRPATPLAARGARRKLAVIADGEADAVKFGSWVEVQVISRLCEYSL
jgi:hypothetical protein